MRFFSAIFPANNNNLQGQDSKTILKPSLRMDFNRSAWGDENNCYAYALNAPQAGWARPGNLALVKNKEYPDNLITPANIKEYLLHKDGLEEITEYEALSGRFHAIAARVAVNCDYHFYRFDELDGSWSHKHGGGIPENRDGENELITNPGTLKDHIYTEFLGYFAIPPAGILYVPRL